MEDTVRLVFFERDEVVRITYMPKKNITEYLKIPEFPPVTIGTTNDIDFIYTYEKGKEYVLNNIMKNENGETYFYRMFRTY